MRRGVFLAMTSRMRAMLSINVPLRDRGTVWGHTFRDIPNATVPTPQVLQPPPTPVTRFDVTPVRYVARDVTRTLGYKLVVII